MHLSIFIFTVLILSLFLHADLRRLDVAWDKRNLLLLLITAFVMVFGTLLSYWWMWMHQCPLFMRWELDSMSSLGLGFSLFIILVGSLFLIMKRQLKCRQLLVWAEPCQDSDLIAKVDLYVQKIALKQRPEICIGNMAKAFAATFSVLNPVILLSQQTVEKLDQEELESVLVHELFHIQQNDLWLTIIAGLISDLLWFVPGVQRVFKTFLQATECWADFLTVNLTQKPGAMASALLKFGVEPLPATLHETLYFSSPANLQFLSEEDAGGFEHRLNLLLDDQYSQKPSHFSSALGLLTPIVMIVWLSLLWFTPYCHLLY